MSRKPDGDVFAHLAFLVAGAALALAAWGVWRTGEWRAPGTEAFSQLTAGLASIATAVAVFGGAAWAYYKFIRSRTFKARLSIQIAGEWQKLADLDVLLVRITASNIGAAKVSLNQHGSGLKVATPVESTAPEHAVIWRKLHESREVGEAPIEQYDKVFEVLVEHDWIEPGETVVDELLLYLGTKPDLVMLEMTLMWALTDRYQGSYSDKDVDVFTRRILPRGEKISDTVAR